MVSASPRTDPTSDHRTEEWRVTTEEALSTPEDRGEGPSTPPSPTLEKQQRLHMLPSDEVEPVVGQEPASEDSGENGVTDGSGHFQQQGAVVPAIDGANHPAAPRPTAPTHSRVPSQVVHPSSVGDDRPPSSTVHPVSNAAADPATSSVGASHPHLDLATFPTPDLLKLLASLLQQIAQANDALRPENSSVTVDAATHDTPASAETTSDASRTVPGRAPAASRSSSSTSSGGHGRIAADSLVIPPYRPKPVHSTASAISTAASPPSATPAKSPSSSTVPTVSPLLHLGRRSRPSSDQPLSRSTPPLHRHAPIPLHSLTRKPSPPPASPSRIPPPSSASTRATFLPSPSKRIFSASSNIVRSPTRCS